MIRSKKIVRMAWVARLCGVGTATSRSTTISYDTQDKIARSHNADDRAAKYVQCLVCNECREVSACP